MDTTPYVRIHSLRNELKGILLVLLVLVLLLSHPAKIPTTSLPALMDGLIDKMDGWMFLLLKTRQCADSVYFEYSDSSLSLGTGVSESEEGRKSGREGFDNMVLCICIYGTSCRYVWEL